ncbi:MAG: WD40 repeat domain-containing protein [Planctomicrobium sp.]|jgi:WD40 repeat protein|nr:WD40 repeat domain-containing protein [Planctomicrobium sp.]
MNKVQPRWTGLVQILLIIIQSLFLPSATVIEAAEPPITSITFTSDGKSVLAASQAGVNIYDWPNLKRRGKLEFAFANIHDIQFSPDAQRLAIAGGNPGETGVVNVFGWQSRDTISALRQHQDSVYSIAWMNDNRRIVSVSLDRQVLLCHDSSERKVQKFAGHSKGVTAVCLLKDDTILVTAGIDQSLRVWDVSTGKMIRTLNNHTAPIHDLQYRPNHDGLPMVASISDDRTLRFWQPTIGRMVRFVKLDSIPLAVVWHPQKPIVATTTSMGNIAIVDAETAEILKQIKTNQKWIYALVVSPDGKWIVTQGEDGLQRHPFLEE